MLLNSSMSGPAEVLCCPPNLSLSLSLSLYLSISVFISVVLRHRPKGSLAHVCTLSSRPLAWVLYAAACQVPMPCCCCCSFVTHCGSFRNGGPYYSTLNSRILIITQTKVPPNFGKLPCMSQTLPQGSKYLIIIYSPKS